MADSLHPQSPALPPPDAEPKQDQQAQPDANALPSHPVVQSQSSPNSASPICRVPLEVLLDITSYLTTVELGHVRLTCKHVETSLLGSFSREFFSRRAFLLTEFGLRALVDISRSRFAPLVTAVTFGTFTPPGFQEQFARGFYGGAGTPSQQRNRIEELQNFRALFLSDEILQYLESAFANLPNLDLVGIRDYNAAGRRRDGPHANWQCYGFTTFKEKTGQHPMIPGDPGILLPRLFWLVLKACTKTPRMSVRHFETYFRHSSCPDSVFSPVLRMPSLFWPMLSELTSLIVTVGIREQSLSVQDSRPGGNHISPCPSFHLRRFLQFTPGLERLRINCSRSVEPAYDNGLVSWLAKLPPATAEPKDSDPPTDISSRTTEDGINLPPDPVELPKLRELELSSMSLDPAALLEVLRTRGRSLSRLSLHKIQLLGDSEVAEFRKNLWSIFFARMARLDLNNLTDLQVSCPSQKARNGERPVMFDNGARSKSWKGQSLAHALKDFKDSVNVEWPPDPVESSESMADVDDDPLSESHNSDSDDDVDGDGEDV